MLIRKGYRFRLDTSRSVEALARQFAGCNRFVWNKALALQKARLESGQRCLPYTEIANMLPSWKTEHPFLKEAPSQTLQQTLKSLDRALQAAFDKSDPRQFPVFKKRGRSRDSFTYPQGFKVKNRRVFLPKLGWVSFRKSRCIKGVPKNLTVSREIDHWHISIQSEILLPDVVVNVSSESAVGIDMGVANLMTLSDGTAIKPLNAFETARKKLARLQRQLARQVKFSINWRKQKKKIQKLHLHVANMRRDYLHKVSHTISKNHAVLCMEDLQVNNMSRSAKGTIESPGRNVKAKAGLNRAIVDQGWSELRRQLEYKLRWRGGTLVLVPPHHTSQRCSKCGHTEVGNRPSQKVFQCLRCGHVESADVNATKNILGAGLALLACGEMAQSGRSVKQEVRSRRAA